MIVLEEELDSHNQKEELDSHNQKEELAPYALFYSN